MLFRNMVEDFIIVGAASQKMMDTKFPWELLVREFPICNDEEEDGPNQKVHQSFSFTLPENTTKEGKADTTRAATKVTIQMEKDDICRLSTRKSQI